MKISQAAGVAAHSMALTLSVSSLALAQEQSVEEFYTGNTITLVISAAPGGASDFFARQFAPYLSKHVPGQPQVVITNQPGASGMVAALSLEQTAPRDGTTMAILQRNNFYLPLVQPAEYQFDPQAVQWIGSLNKEHYTLIAWDDAPVETAEDLFDTELTLGATTFANENRTLPAILNEHFGAKIKIVTGYDGNEAVGLALERGEVQARAQTVNSLMSGSEAEWLAQGRIKVLLQLALEAHPKFPDVPVITDFTDDPEVLALTNFMLAPMAAGRPFALPPEVPEDRVAALREAFMAAANDSEFVAKMEAANSSVEPISGEEVEAIIADLYETPEPVLEMVRELLIE